MSHFLGPEVLQIVSEPCEELEATVEEWLGFDEPVLGRMSRLFLAQLTAGVRHRLIDVMALRDELLHLEDPGRPTRTRSPAPFRKEPLKGLHHKHYFEARYLLGNMDGVYGLSRGGNQRLTDAIGSAFDRAQDTNEMFELVGELMINFPYETRSANRTLTGEWIIYATASTGNAYFTLAAHKDPDEEIAAAIRAHCETRLFSAIEGW